MLFQWWCTEPPWESQVVLIAFGFPAITGVVLKRRAAELRAEAAAPPAVIAGVAEELGLEHGAAALLMQCVFLSGWRSCRGICCSNRSLLTSPGFAGRSSSAGVMASSSTPSSRRARPGNCSVISRSLFICQLHGRCRSCLKVPIADMLRKMILVGVMVVLVPGSLFQIWVAALLSLFFLGAHFHSWPYKLPADNLLKAATEVMVFVTILAALVLKNPDLGDERVDEQLYDLVLVGCYALLPAAFVAVSCRSSRPMLT